MKLFAAVLSFFFMWFAVAVIVGWGVLFLFPPQSPVIVGVGFDWRNLPGTMIGFFAGLHSARAALR
jgi:hypothetical protein